MAKAGAVLLATLAGALLFAGGLLTPDSTGQAIKALFSSGAPSTAMPVAAAAASAAVQPASSAASVATTASPSVPLGSLLLSTLPAATATYALQAGQFASQQTAQQLAAGIQGQGVTATVVLTVDTSSTTWAVVAIGRYPSAEEARSQRNYLANRLGLPQPPPVIVLPPAKPSP